MTSSTTRKRTSFVEKIASSILVILLLLLLLILVQWGYSAPWTGFGDFTAPSGQGEFVRGKTLWDWMELLIIPLFLAGGAIFFNNSERKNEREIAHDRQQEIALQAYLDQLAELLISENLRETGNDAVRDVARIRTLTVLRQLDASRKETVVLFLKEAGLIEANAKPIINLTGADLSGVNLSRADLRNAGLRNANLMDATLLATDLRHADLSGANMQKTNLNFANLSNANLHNINLHRARLRKADLKGVDLNAAEMRGADLQEANLHTANMAGAKLSGANFRKANLGDANLQGADLFDIKRINETNQKFFYFWIFDHIYGEEFAKIILVADNKEFQPADFSFANTFWANMYTLRETNLTGANLSEAKVMPFQLDRTKSLKGAKMPDGTIHE